MVDPVTSQLIEETKAPHRANALKFARDLVALAVAGGLLAIAENAADIGVPATYSVVISAGALYVYRELRSRGWLRALGAEPK